MVCGCVLCKGDDDVHEWLYLLCFVGAFAARCQRDPPSPSPLGLGAGNPQTRCGDVCRSSVVNVACGAGINVAPWVCLSHGAICSVSADRCIQRRGRSNWLLIPRLGRIFLSHLVTNNPSAIPFTHPCRHNSPHTLTAPVTNDIHSLVCLSVQSSWSCAEEASRSPLLIR